MKIFQEKIWIFYKENKRKFPWRETTDPYKILVSEVMLQQTQTGRVISKYHEFFKKFPTLKSLTQATNVEVLSVWSGLGYNRRGLYLKRTAEEIAKNYHGKIPLNPETLVTFPGIGPNTAGSIYVFTTNKPFVFIETNIRRVFIHEFFKDQEKIGDKEILKLLQENLDQENPREFYYALMDYGAFLGKTQINPNRRSKGYIKQSAFEGSVRQVRGKILKLLLEEKKIEKKLLKEKINSIHFYEALQQLVKEGFIQLDNQIALLA